MNASLKGSKSSKEDSKLKSSMGSMAKSCNSILNRKTSLKPQSKERKADSSENENELIGNYGTAINEDEGLLKTIKDG